MSLLNSFNRQFSHSYYMMLITSRIIMFYIMFYCDCLIELCSVNADIIIILLAFTTHFRVFSLLILEVSRSHTMTHHSR
jgi:hypothetical protein